MIDRNVLHFRYSVGNLSLSLKDLPKIIKVSDLMASLELKSSVPSQLVELLDYSLKPMPMNLQLEFGLTIRSGILLTVTVHPAWMAIVEHGILGRWSEVFSLTHSIGSEATEMSIFLTIKYGSLQDLRRLIKMGAEINGTTLFERSCLHLAAFHGRVDMIHELLGNGISATKRDVLKHNARDYATKNGFYEAARWCWLGQWSYGSNGGVAVVNDENLQKESTTKRSRPSSRGKSKRPDKGNNKPNGKKKIVADWLKDNETNFYHDNRKEIAEPMKRSSKENIQVHVTSVKPSRLSEGKNVFITNDAITATPPEENLPLTPNQSLEPPPRPAKKRPSSIRFDQDTTDKDKYTNARKSTFVRPEGLPIGPNRDPPLNDPGNTKPRGSKVSFGENTHLSERYTNARKSIFPTPQSDSDSDVQAKESKVSFSENTHLSDRYTNARKSIFPVTQSDSDSDGQPEGLPMLSNPDPRLNDPGNRKQRESKVSFSENTYLSERYTNARKSIFPTVQSESDSDDVFESVNTTKSEQIQFPPINAAVPFRNNSSSNPEPQSVNKPVATTTINNKENLIDQQHNSARSRPSSSSVQLRRKTNAPSEKKTVFIARDASAKYSHVDQLGKYEIEKLAYVPPPPVEPVSFTASNYGDEFQINLERQRTAPEYKLRSSTSASSVKTFPTYDRVEIPHQTKRAHDETSKRLSSRQLDKRPSQPPRSVDTTQYRLSRAVSSPNQAVDDDGSGTRSKNSFSVHRPRSYRSRSSTADQQKQIEQKKAEEDKRRAAASEAYKIWLNKKRNFIIRRTSPEPDRNRDVKWYENKKRMFEPDDMEPRVRKEVKFQSRSIDAFNIQTEASKIHPSRKYIGNGLKFEDWLERKKSSVPSKPIDNDEEKRKANELREIMAQEKFKEWLDSKITKRKESSLTDKEKYEQQQDTTADTQKLSFEQWMEQKRTQDRNLKKLMRKLRSAEETEENDSLKKKLSFEDWMIQKEQAALYGDRAARDYARQNAKLKQQQNEERKRKREEEAAIISTAPTDDIVLSGEVQVPIDERTMNNFPDAADAANLIPINVQTQSRNNSVTSDHAPTHIISDYRADKIPEQNKNNDTVATIHELSVGVITELKENGEQIVSQMLPKPLRKNNPLEEMTEPVQEDNVKSTAEKTRKRIKSSENTDHKVQQDMKVQNTKETTLPQTLATDTMTSSAHQIEDNPDLNPIEINSQELTEDVTDTHAVVNRVVEGKISLVDNVSPKHSGTPIEVSDEISYPGADYFVDSDDSISHSSLDTDMEDAELLKLIDILDSD